MKTLFVAVLTISMVAACSSNKQPKSPCACDFEPLNTVSVARG